MSFHANNMKVLYYLKCYKSRMSVDLYDAENEDKSYLQQEISLLEKCIETTCLSSVGHNWEKDEYEIKGEIMPIIICTVCDSIKS